MLFECCHCDEVSPSFLTRLLTYYPYDAHTLSFILDCIDIIFSWDLSDLFPHYYRLEALFDCLLSLSVVKKMPEDLIDRFYRQYDVVRTLESRLNERDVRKENEVLEEPQNSPPGPPRVDHWYWSLLLLALCILLVVLQGRRSGYDVKLLSANYTESVGRVVKNAVQCSGTFIRNQISGMKQSMEKVKKQKSDMENEAIEAFLEQEWKWKVENEGREEEKEMEVDAMGIDGGKDETKEGIDESELEKELGVHENEFKGDVNSESVKNETVESWHESGDNVSFEDHLLVAESVITPEVGDDSEATETSINKLDRMEESALEFEEKAEVEVKEVETEVITEQTEQTEQTEPQSEASAVNLDDKIGEEESASEESDSEVEMKPQVAESLPESSVMRNSSVDASVQAEHEQYTSADSSEPQTSRLDIIPSNSSDVAPSHVSTNLSLTTSSTEGRSAIGTDYIVSHLLLRFIRTVILTVSSKQCALFPSRWGVFGVSTANHRHRFYCSASSRH